MPCAGTEDCCGPEFKLLLSAFNIVEPSKPPSCPLTFCSLLYVALRIPLAPAVPLMVHLAAAARRVVLHPELHDEPIVDTQ